MNIFQVIVLLILSVVLVGCDSGSKAEDDKQAKKTIPIIPEYQINALNKAKGVEDIILDAKEKRYDGLMDN